MSRNKTVQKIGIEELRLLPPAPGKCPICAAEHEPELPHNKNSLYYQMRFRQQHGRFPDWRDACAHCTDEVKRRFAELYAEHGVSIDVGLSDEPH